MTENEYIDEMKRLGASVYKCSSCGFRAFGLPVSAHELKTKHKMIREPFEWELPKET